LQTGQSHSQIVVSSEYMSLPCDRCDSKSLLADPSALRTTPEARFRSKNCTTTAGAELDRRSRRIFSERRQIQPVTVLRAGTRRQPAENEPIGDAVTQADVPLDKWHKPPCEAQGRLRADLSAGAPGTPRTPNPENPTTEANAHENAVTIQNEGPFAVPATWGLDSPLDKRVNPPCRAQGRSSVDLSAPSPRAPGTSRPQVDARYIRLKSLTAKHAELAKQIDRRIVCNDTLPIDSSWTGQMDFFRSLVLGLLRVLGILGGETSGLIVLAREQRKSRSQPRAPVEETPRSSRRVRLHRLIGFVGSASDERPVNVHCSSLTPHPSSLCHPRLNHVCGLVWAAGCAAPSEAAQAVAPHKQMAIAVLRQPPEFAHLSEVCDNVDLAPTSLAQGPNAPQSTSRNAPNREKCAKFPHARKPLQSGRRHSQVSVL
jgi:hypothetical protein